MAIRELIRRGYWKEREDDGSELNGGADNSADEAGSAAVDGAAGEAEGAGEPDGEGGEEGEEAEGLTLAEEIAKSIGLEKKDGKEGGTEGTDGDEGEGETDGKAAVPNQKPVEKAEGEDPYAEPDWLKKASRQAQDRFHELVRLNKDKDHQLERVTQDARGFVEMVRDTGANQEQFLEILDTAQLIYHPEKSNPEEAIKRLYNAARMVAEASGLPLPGYDPLDAHPDLLERVNKLDLDRETAEELARVRNRDGVQARVRDQYKSQRQQQDQTIAATEKAIGEITTFLNDRQAKDVDFPAKAEMMKKAAAFARDNLPPAQWVGYMQQQYEIVTGYAKSTVSKPSNSGHQPLRPGGGGKSQKTPGSLQEAIKQNLGL